MVEEKKIELTSQQLEALYSQERSRLETINRQKNYLINILNEHDATINALNEINKTKEKEILVPLGGGVFVDATLGSKKVKTSLTNNVLMDSTIEETVKELEKKKSEIKEGLEKLEKDQNNIITNINNLGRIINIGRQQSQKFREEQLKTENKTDESKKKELKKK